MSTSAPLAFIGGGNMATAIIGGLLRSGCREAGSILVIDPGETQRRQLEAEFGVSTLAAAGPELSDAATVVWAVKPQFFRLAAKAYARFVRHALQVSVMAGIRSDTIGAAIGETSGAAIGETSGTASEAHRIVRAMPNTPALIGHGIAGLFASPAVTASERVEVEAILAPTGQLLWLDRESDLDAVTALSGSGPAYVFYFIEAMTKAARDMGLSDAQGRQLALATFAGATRLAEESTEPPAVLRERVTSKGGTTFAALAALDASGVKAAFVDAIRAAQQRAQELGDEFGSSA